MNYFAHGRLFTDTPYLLAGTAVPDWLNVVDRKIRARSRSAELLLDSPDAITAGVARGIVQHHADDAWFHRTRAFAELTLQFTSEIRDFLGPDDGLRCHFLGHILVEILLDSKLIEEDAAQLEAYYAALEKIDGEAVARVVSEISGRNAQGIAWLLPRFIEERFLWDYPVDDKLLVRLNQVMRRVKLPQLPEGFGEIFPAARHAIGRRAAELLSPPCDGDI
ncbi:MAG: hypothetical protein P8K78_10260 [Pirellulales bacterium]|nr:hypothetical protein [Pirellulales bacterium]